MTYKYKLVHWKLSFAFRMRFLVKKTFRHICISFNRGRSYHGDGGGITCPQILFQSWYVSLSKCLNLQSFSIYMYYVVVLSFLLERRFWIKFPFYQNHYLYYFHVIARFFYVNQVKSFIEEQENNVCDLIALHTSQ